VNRQRARVFIDTNMLIFAMQYRKENVFDWIDLLYSNVWIHVDVLAELLQGRKIIEQEINKRRWQIFDPENLTSAEGTIYRNYLNEIKNAFRQMNVERAIRGERVKSTADIGEISSLAVCLLEDAQLICSNDADIKTVVAQEQYTYIDAHDGSQHLIIQDTAEDFCFYCVIEAGVAQSRVRHFYKSIFENSEIRARKLSIFDERLQQLNNE